jgi:uncharacterized membrane protein YidH (DUF202 family)
MLSNLFGIVNSEAILLIAWTLAMVMIGYLNWRDDVVAHRAVNPLGMVTQCALVEGVGLALLTMTVIVAFLLVGTAPY